MTKKQKIPKELKEIIKNIPKIPKIKETSNREIIIVCGSVWDLDDNEKGGRK